MPHDVNGNVVKDGDLAYVLCKISNVSSGEKACNCKYTVLIPDGVDESYAPEFAGNTRLSQLAGKPLPTDGKVLHPSIEGVLKFFKYDHLPPFLQEISKPFHALAHRIAVQGAPEPATDTPRPVGNPETTVALRKLLEAKDAAVRAALP